MEAALTYIRKLLLARLHNYESIEQQALPECNLKQWGEALSQILPIEKLEEEDCLAISLALIPHVRPYFFDSVIQEVYPQGGTFPHMGGIRGKNHRGFIPTVETVLFALSGNDLKKRFKVHRKFSSTYWWAEKKVLHYNEFEKGEPPTSSPIRLDQDYVDKYILGKIAKPVFSNKFPASLISTKMNWDDLVLNNSTQKQIEDIFIWLNNKDKLNTELGLNRKLKPGYRALFYGPPGTGKTLTATLLGKSDKVAHKRDVYRIDLSSVVSKYIGETEKNLSSLFDRAANRDWILFFDEADALFGKRTQVQNAHDRYANQEVAYLLQRIENFDGLVILSSNLKSNIDDAFIRRFQSIITFPMPKINERYRLWHQSLPDKMELDKDVDLMYLAQQFELTGADIINIVQYVCLTALSKNRYKLFKSCLISGIRREYAKGGRIFKEY